MNGMYGLYTTVVGRTRGYLSCEEMQFRECFRPFHCVRIRKVIHKYEVKKTHACLILKKTINGHVGIAVRDIRKPTSALFSSTGFAVPWVL